MDANRRFIACCILVTELCERLTFYSITANVVVFLSENLQLGTSSALIINGVFVGTSYFLPVIGGLIADSIAGRFNAIYGAGLVYIVGALLLPTAAFGQVFQSWDMSITFKQLYFLIGLFTVAIGTGGIKANVGPFGASQVEDLGEGAVQSFFQWFYWFINVGSAIAFALVAYVQQEVNYFYGYLIPAVSMILAVITFTAARDKYKDRPPEGSVLSRIAKIVWEGCVTKRHSTISKSQSFLDRAKESFGGSYLSSEVEDVKSVGRVIPIFLTFIPYWTLVNQMQSTFLLQAQRMDLQLGSITLPAASLNLFNTVIILIVVPIMDFVVFPLLEKFNRRPTPLQKIGFGYLLAAACLVVGGFLEISRKEDIAFHGGFPQKIGNTVHNASNITVLAQVPQFMLMGASEVFASITGLEFAFSQAPPELSGVIMGLFLSANGFGAYLGSALVAIVNGATNPQWLPDDINDGWAEYFFFLLAGLMVLNFAIFVALAFWYKYAPTTSTGASDEILLSDDNDEDQERNKNSLESFKSYNSTEM